MVVIAVQIRCIPAKLHKTCFRIFTSALACTFVFYQNCLPGWHLKCTTILPKKPDFTR